MLLRRKLGQYLEFTERKENLENRYWFGKWISKVRKKK
jgi:hypothetical protein